MNDENLIPFSKRSESEQRAIRPKGGKTVTPRQRIATKLRWMKEKGFKEKDSLWFYSMMKDPEYSEAEILRALLVIRNDPNSYNFYNRLLMDWHKLRHGTKEKKDTINVNMKSYKFIVEVEGDGVSRDTMETYEEATPSV